MQTYPVCPHEFAVWLDGCWQPLRSTFLERQDGEQHPKGDLWMVTLSFSTRCKAFMDNRLERFAFSGSGKLYVFEPVTDYPAETREGVERDSTDKFWVSRMLCALDSGASDKSDEPDYLYHLCQRFVWPDAPLIVGRDETRIGLRRTTYPACPHEFAVWFDDDWHVIRSVVMERQCGGPHPEGDLWKVLLSFSLRCPTFMEDRLTRFAVSGDGGLYVFDPVTEYPYSIEEGAETDEPDSIERYWAVQMLCALDPQASDLQASRYPGSDDIPSIFVWPD